MRRVITILIVVLLSTIVAQGQIRIGGNVYGGGNHAEVRGSAKVTVREGDLQSVFGGARMANVGGHTFVNIDGENATGDIMAVSVYGGNDISGTIGTPAAVNEEVPTELTDDIPTEEARASVTPVDRKPYMNVVNDTWNCFVRMSRSTKDDGVTEKWPIVIGSIYGGGNGDFTYTDENGNALRDGDNNYIAKEGNEIVAVSKTPLFVPEIDKTYLELKGGCAGHVYGGGNNATVRVNTTLNIANESSDLLTLATQYAAEHSDTTVAGVLGYYQQKVQLNSFQSDLGSYAYNFARIYGGNNRAEMAIRPTWNLQAGKIRDLYSGGNRGNMTSPEGLLLEIKPEKSAALQVYNVFGGCRMADVKPTVNGEYTPCMNLPGYNFPNELSARTLIRGGHITNVYGGNDITGNVYGGNAVGIYTTIYGDVYGGGNGAYAYTNLLGEDDKSIFHDFYYPTEGYTSYIDALNAHRPNAEQVSIRLAGTEDKKTVIHGSVYVGGNSASIAAKKQNPLVELKIGSYVVADNVYLGNNGEKMANKDILKLYAGNVDLTTGKLDTSGSGSPYSSIDLTVKSSFANYMEGVAMKQIPNIVFDKVANGDPVDYIDYSSYVGSFFCGGNVGSMAIPGKMSFTIDRKLNIFRKFVGGCNNANVKAKEGFNAAYEGGIIGSEDERDSYTDSNGNIKDRLEINFENMTVVPMRWDNTFTQVAAGTTLTEGQEYYRTNLRSSKFIADGTEVADDGLNTYYELTAYGDDFEWNTAYWNQDEKDFKKLTDDESAVGKDLRLLDGNIYGGCYNSGHVNGNVVININEDVVKKDQIFKDFGNSTTNDAGYTKPAVAFEDQRDDVLAIAMSVFGAGYGEDTEIWGSTTVNHNNGYAFQVFGGGEEGVVGKKTDILDEHGEYKESIYEYNPSYSTTVNLSANATASSNDGEVADLAEAEYLYGGGNMGNVSGNTLVNLGNGRIYDAFGGASDADILGHTEVYIGRQPNGSGGYKAGFPWIRDIVYGGNDFGGTIHGAYEDGYNFEARLRDYETDKTQLHGYKAGEIPDVLKSSSYVEYLQGRVDTIFGGGYGKYDYTAAEYLDEDNKRVYQPFQHSSFVNIRPNNHGMNSITGIFGGSTGYPGDRTGDEAQNRSYVLIDIPDGMTNFGSMVVFGAGSYNGIGMGQNKEQLANGTLKLDEASSIVDLLRGRIRNVYGGSYFEGNTRRTVVNVPAASSIQVDNIFGGAYGMHILPPCDVYETQVNYKNTSEKAQVFGAIYGGNNNQRRSLFTQVNISSPVWSNKEKGYTGTVYGAGRGYNSWSEYTEVNLEKGARLYNVYGGAELGHVLNSASVQAYQKNFENTPSPDIIAEDSKWATASTEDWKEAWKAAWSLGDYFTPTGNWTDDNYAANTYTSLARVSERAELDDKTAAQLDGQKKHNTNVLIKEGAVVEGYAYGGGLGSSSIAGSGDVYGTTYIAVLGGEVKKDVYAGGRAGGVDNLFGVNDFAGHKFVASANAYIMGGTARNVYGGGYEGDVGYHAGDILASYATDRPALSHVVIGKKGTNTFAGGAPAITRNVYGGGEGGSLFGTSNVTINNGYIGYRYTVPDGSSVGTYEEELDDQKPGDLDLSGNVFGGGYVINSYVDSTNIKMYGGTVRGSLYGGGEIGPIGRGSIRYNANGCLTNGDANIRHAGQTNVTMYDGKVLRNVFGGGRGKDSWGGDGTMYMDPSLVATLDMKCKGFVFGQTRVNIHGGEIGTDEGMAYGYGNVFGGGDEGTVYSAYMADETNDEIDNVILHVGTKSGKRYDGSKEGYYYKGETTALTEDCKVVVEPHAQAYVPITINSHSYASGDYVPTSDLNTLQNKTAGAAYWDNLDPDGIIIHNAVFAGGNLAAGSSSLFANATTVYGNATASIHDVYNRDLITIGTGHTGGLYGDGNLTFVDGYRELNITNYGTDYYHITKQLTYDAYKDLPEREKAYYELKYKCLKECTDNEGTTYKKDATLPQDELLLLFAGTDKLTDGQPNPTYWQENGVVSVYAGRIMNTIQRADFCGVFGSRMVMKGAPDRVPEKVDYTNYTINRVREVSLNKKVSVAGDTGENASHGNYFGIYNTVNYLGALTSDVKFSDVRTTNSDDTSVAADGNTTFYAWKQANIDNKKRNNGNCHNHLALASGVSLELTSEKSTGKELNQKDWGPITGVVELDLINVQPGMGGGFVYAKNEHGEPTGPNGSINTLTALNSGAATKGQYTYAELDGSRHQWQTSGNFIHSSQTIIDDCYNVSNRYLSTNFVPAHYWYIAGSVYVYDQYISAYTGSPNAYSEKVEIPITINAAAHGTMTLMDVRPNRYAYYSSVGTPLTGDQKLVIKDVTYQKNTPISYWDWQKLSAAEKALFVEETYVNTKAYKTTAESEEIIAANSQVVLTQPGGELYSVAEEKMVPASEIFRSSNNMSHNTGYLLTYNMTNPSIWDKWYTKVTNETQGVVVSDQTGGSDYEDGPTYHPTADGLYGQKQYDVNAIIPKATYDAYEGLGGNKPTSDDQAVFTKAYLVTKEYDDATQHYYLGAPVSTAKTDYTADAYVSTATIQLSPTEYIYVNDLMTAEQKEKYKTDYPTLATDIEDVVKPAYICTTAGLYGGCYYETDKNYRALQAYSAMSPADREKFAFNYDALDLLIDPKYGKKSDGSQQDQGKKYQYDGKPYDYVVTDANKADMIYSLTKPIDYTATYNGSTDATAHNGITLTNGKEYPGTEFEKLPNEQRHYAPIAVAAAGGTYYVVKESFVLGDKPYTVGTTVSSETYTGLSDTDKQNIAEIFFPNAGADKTYYYCREEYEIGENTEGVAVTSATGVTGATGATGSNYAVGATVPVGVVIDDLQYTSLKNYQKNFTIHGVSPMETSTLYVARDADINDLSTEKIITVVYKYDYEESDVDGMHVVPVSERHVVNIHINFKSGVPEVEDINPPTIVLPGTGITMRIPSVTPGAYEITGGGWELFETESNAESHINGVPYTPSVDPLYWYQDGFYLAYYAKTYLGKTYSNYVPVSVANYHDLKRVMDDKQNHLHVDYDRNRLKRDSKIYINDYSASSENGLDLFKNFYDLSVLNSPSVDDNGLIKEGTFIGHKPLNNSTATGTNIYDGSTNVKGVKGGQNLEFFLRTDIKHTTAWTAIGTDDQCFEGTFHGDGHTISGLNNSLFYNLCGNVYNLGVTGSFNSAGVVDKGTGYVESAWINTTGTPASGVRAVFGNPTATNDIKQIVNSYYQAGKSYSTTDTGSHGLARAMSDQAFYNGTVAYDLNNFYLYKRYNDGTGTSSGVEYKYWIPGEEEPQTGHYANNIELCSSGYNNIKYVEERFKDGDFRYAGGTIPDSEDERFYTKTLNPGTEQETVESGFYPIWPDDYIFFGQKLTYGWAAQAHQDVPTAVVRADGRLSDGDDANRVYRAPAYYRSNKMGVAHFNPHAYLAQQEKLTAKQIEDNVTPREAYPKMTAIDFKGHYGANEAYGAYGLGWNTQTGQFYTPLLDDDGLLSIRNCDETQNLLAYAPSADVNAKTHGVLTSYFTEPVYADHYDNTNGYRLVSEASAASVHGHLVQSDKTAINDHLLVDKQDFNAPIAYTFDADHLMWYQRLPSDKEYVDLTQGWQGISIPFTAELVTTDTKGEITHFYSGSSESENGTGTKKGHEYWLRQLTDGETMTKKDANTLVANFHYPNLGREAKSVGNTFLWDYYYKNEPVHDQQDKNADTYLQYRQYYKTARSYAGYPLLTAATPYIIGFPGKTYYEFDLSGKFDAQNTAVSIPRLGKQTITFASNKGASIGVSDNEMTGTVVTNGGNNYTFKPSYMNENLDAGSNSYALDGDGKSYDKVPATGSATAVSAFRPYFTVAASPNNAPQMPKQIVFGTSSSLNDGPETVLNGELEIYAKDHKIITTSHLKEPTTISIFNVAGISLANYVLKPGETVETPIAVDGVYIVNKKKLFVK